MPYIAEFEDWIKSNGGNEGVASKMDVAPATVSAWRTGRNNIKPVYKAKLRELEYLGPFPDEADQPVTQANLQALQDNVLGRVEWMREEVRKENAALAEALDLILKHLGIELKRKP